MTREEAQAKVNYIRKIRHDDEAAHCEEDALRKSVLEAIANDTRAPDHIRELAAIALSTREIRFARWCA